MPVLLLPCGSRPRAGKEEGPPSAWRRPLRVGVYRREKKTQPAQGHIDSNGLKGAAAWGKKRPVCDQTQDSAVRKTQLGQGQIRRDRQRGSCCEGGLRPACKSVRDRRGESDAALRRHCRTACMEAATQPRDGCAVAMRNGRMLGALRPWCPVLRTGIGGAVLDPSTGSRSEKALVPPGLPSGERGSIPSVRSLGGCSESEARSYAAGPGFGGREPSRFLGTKRWKSQKLTQLSPEQPSGWKTSEGVAGQLSAHHSLRLCCHFAGSGPGLSFATGPRFNIRQSPAIVHSATLLATSSSVCLKQLIYAVIASGQVSASTPEAFCGCEARRKLQHSRQARRGQRPFPSP